MDTQQRIFTLYHAGLSVDAIAAILDADHSDIAATLHVPDLADDLSVAGAFTPDVPPTVSKVLRHGDANYYTVAFGSGDYANADAGPIDPGALVLHHFDIDFPCQIAALAWYVKAVGGATFMRGHVFEDYDGWAGDHLAQGDNRPVNGETTVFSQLGSPVEVRQPTRFWVGYQNSGAATVTPVSLGFGYAPQHPSHGPDVNGAAAGYNFVPPGDVADSMRDIDPTTGAVRMQSGHWVSRTWLYLTPLAA
jgi:hypothetical protein